jgi:hypothetical protein
MGKTIYSEGFRDLSVQQFRKALERNGFKLSPIHVPGFGCYFTDELPTSALNKGGKSHIPALYSRKGRMLRRATIAYLLQRRDDNG